MTTYVTDTIHIVDGVPRIVVSRLPELYAQRDLLPCNGPWFWLFRRQAHALGLLYTMDLTDDDAEEWSNNLPSILDTCRAIATKLGLTSAYVMGFCCGVDALTGHWQAALDLSRCHVFQFHARVGYLDGLEARALLFPVKSGDDQ